MPCVGEPALVASITNVKAGLVYLMRCKELLVILIDTSSGKREPEEMHLVGA